MAYGRVQNWTRRGSRHKIPQIVYTTYRLGKYEETAEKIGSSSVHWRHRKATRTGLSTRSGSGSVVEHLLAKEGVEGSNPFFRSKLLLGEGAVRTYGAIFITSRPDGSYEVECRSVDENGDPFGTHWLDDPVAAAKLTGRWEGIAENWEHVLRMVFPSKAVAPGRLSMLFDDGSRTDIFLDGELM